MPVLDRLPPTARSVLRETREQNITLLAASTAYSAFVSLLPLVALLVVVTLVIGQEPLSEEVLTLTRGVLAPAARGVVAEALANTSARAGASLVGVVTLLWGALKLFRGLDAAFSQIYDTPGRGSVLDQLRDSLVVLTALAFAVVVAVAAGGLLTFLEGTPLVGIVAPLFLLVGLALSFFPIYYIFPDRDLSVPEVLPGVAVAAVGWLALEYLFRLYVGFAGSNELYGVLGGVLLLLTWLYLASLLLLLGGVLNAVLGGWTDARAVEESPDDTEYERLRARYRRLWREHASLRAEYRRLERRLEDPPAEESRPGE